MKVKLMSILLISLMLLTACGSNEELVDEEQLPLADDSQLITYGVAGRITEITSSASDGEMFILVEGDLENNGAEYDKAYVKISSDTVIYGKEELTSESLELGQYVNVFFEGPVMESYPVQASAKQVNIVPEEALEFNDDPTEE